MASRGGFAHSVFFSIALVMAAGCATRPGLPAQSFTDQSAASSTTPQRAIQLDPDLELFGRSATMRDVGFEGTAVTDIQRHTMAGEGADFDPSVDPSGKRLVFASTRHSRFSHLFIKAMDGASCTPITDENGNDSQPAFSPDGRRIAFASDRSGQWDIWVIDADGHNPVQITSNPLPELHPSWSPDGKRIVFCRVNPREGKGELWISHLDNPGFKRFIGEGLFPSWSPRGDKIAYQRARDRDSRLFSIWTLTLEGDGAVSPTEIAGSPDAAYIAPSWSIDGRQIAFASVRSGSDAELDYAAAHRKDRARSDIGVVDADGQGLLLLTNGRDECYSPHCAGDGRVFFTMRRDQAETIWSLRPLRPIIVDEVAASDLQRPMAQGIQATEP